jgi:hypothetical protein
MSTAINLPYHTELRPGGHNRPDREIIVSDIVVPCRCCGAPCEVIWQEPLLPHLGGYWLITCVQPRTACAMGTATLSSRSYPTVEMSDYAARELAGWTMPDLPTPEVQS